MIKALFDYLHSSTALVDLLGYTHENKRINPVFPNNKTDYPYLVYNIYPSRSEHPIKRYHCEVIILSKDLFLLEEISEETMSLLHTLDKPSFTADGKTFFNSKHIRSEGINYDPDQELFEQVLIFEIKTQ